MRNRNAPASATAILAPMGMRDSITTAPAMVMGGTSAMIVTADGESFDLDLAAARRRWHDTPLLICHRINAASRLGVPLRSGWHHHDILELFAFVQPAQFCLPTPSGVASALALEPPDNPESAAVSLLHARDFLLRELADLTYPNRQETAQTAATMARAGWSWAEQVCTVLGPPERMGGPLGGLDIWNGLTEWEEQAPPPPPSDKPVSGTDARDQLARMLGPNAETRAAQADYSAAAASAFQPRQQARHPNLVLAEAGTGIGKTAAYLAPAGLWARQNSGPVWISTYTKNLQRQIERETARLYPAPSERAEKVAIRKGRENYLCLLNLQEAAVGGRPGNPAMLGLIARWARVTRDGDLTGHDFPAWLGDLLGSGAVGGLTDHRGECVYSACAHYRKCYIEKAVRKSRRADIVIANHALVMVQAALEQATEDPGSEGDGDGTGDGTGDGNDAPAGRNWPTGPTRYIFDEGHHIFNAADSAFSAHLSGLETAELRRWIRGGEGGRAGRARGLIDRIGDVIDAEGSDAEYLHAAVKAARALPGPGWWERLNGGQPRGATERLLTALLEEVRARAPDAQSPFSLEVEIGAPPPELVTAANALSTALEAIADPLLQLAASLAARLDAETGELDTATRNRIEALCRGLRRRARVTIGAWRQMLADLNVQTPDNFVDWIGLERQAGRDRDIGLHRRWVDPTIPFAEHLLSQAHGVVITSATLRDRAEAVPDDWLETEIRTGANHLPLPAIRTYFDSPFDYAGQTRVIIIRDVRKSDANQVAAAYRELFVAAGGGALGIFTAIGRLRAVYERLAEPLDAAGLPLYGQHVDGMDVGTLVDIFRAETDSCLLGTDAVRDGVDVPGDALRLIVFDRVPWPRPDILHRARREAFGGRYYDDFIARMRLKQAYGRLLRKSDDRGMFIILDGQTPSRLATAFPQGVAVERMGIAEAVAEARAFLCD